MLTPSKRGKEQNHPRWNDRYGHFWRPGSIRCPRWRDQVIQYMTRGLFFILGFAYFNLVDEIQPALLSLQQLNLIYAAYLFLMSFCFIHAIAQPYSPVRYRLAMWIDILVISISLLNDPYNIPPILLVYLMVVLGNGLRYGMRLFAEAILATVASVMVCLSIRYFLGQHSMSMGVLFMNIFGGIFLLYAYSLMGKVEKARHKSEMSSYHEPLTGLFNRRALNNFTDELFANLPKGEPHFVVMLIDIDRFKAVNDTFGHSRGDQVLQDIAQIFREKVRQSDFAARLGGDEFVLLLENTSLQQGEHMAKRIHAAVEGYMQHQKIDSGISIGLGLAPDHGTTLDTIMAQVDRALYANKSDPQSVRVKRVDQV